jgi:hypothetical protein
MSRNSGKAADDGGLTQAELEDVLERLTVVCGRMTALHDRLGLYAPAQAVGGPAALASGAPPSGHAG